MIGSTRIRLCLAAALFTALTACGGGGGGGGSGGNGGTRPAGASTTYQVTLQGLTLEDTSGGGTVTPAGLPVQGPTITRQ